MSPGKVPKCGLWFFPALRPGLSISQELKGALSGVAAMVAVSSDDFNFGFHLPLILHTQPQGSQASLLPGALSLVAPVPVSAWQG